MSTADERRSIDVLAEYIREELRQIEDEARSYCDFIDESPDLSRLLTEYAAACDDVDGHCSRFKDQHGKWDDQSAECHADWSRCCQRKNAAEHALAKFARVYVSFKTTEAA